MKFDGRNRTALVLHTPKIIRAKSARDFASTQSFRSNTTGVPIHHLYAASTRTCHTNWYPLATGFFTGAPTHTPIYHINAHVPHQQLSIGHRFLYRGADTYIHMPHSHARATPTHQQRSGPFITSPTKVLPIPPHWPPVSLQGRRHIQSYAASTRTCHINKFMYLPPPTFPSLPLLMSPYLLPSSPPPLLPSSPPPLPP